MKYLLFLFISLIYANPNLTPTNQCKPDPRNAIFKFRAKNWLSGLNIYPKYELFVVFNEILDEDDVLDSFIKAFKVFLRRKRNISKRRKDAFYGFTTVIADLMKARERNDPKRLTKARDELSNNPSIPNQDWLIEKIEELEAVIKPSKK